MRTPLFFILFTTLFGCASNQQGRDDGFYTWVDANGVVRTQERLSTPLKAAETTDDVNKQKPETNDFNPSDFTPADQIDDQLEGQKLYAWMENGRQQIAEEIPQNTKKDAQNKAKSKLNISASQSGVKDISPLKTGKIWQYSDIFEREIDLAQYYSFNDRLQRDYLMIDLFELDVTKLSIKTFAKDQSLAYPHFIQLDKQLNRISEKEVNWSGYNHENWASYGHLVGELSIHPDTAFLLILTRVNAGIMEVDGKLIKLVDLGSIEIATNE